MNPIRQLLAVTASGYISVKSPIQRHAKFTLGRRNIGPVFDKRSQIFAIALINNAKFPFSKPNELSVNQADKTDA